MNTKALIPLGLLALGACNDKATFTAGSADDVRPHVAVDESFPAALIDAATVKFKPPFGIVDETLTLREAAPVTTYLTQASRVQVQDAFKQGNDGTSADESFDITSAGKLDMVMVIDDSSSMDSEQTQLQSGLANLLSSLANVDWQIVVTTSSQRETCIRDVGDLQNGTKGGPGTILTKTAYDANPTAVAQQYMLLITPGSSGDSNERTLYGARRALDQTFQNNDLTNGTKCLVNNWTRAGAALAVFVVTDEDDCHISNETNFHHTSVNVTDPASPDYTPDYADTNQNGCAASEYNGTDLTGEMALAHTPGVDARMYGIFWPRGTDIPALQAYDPPRASPTANDAWAHQGMVTSTNGTFGSLAAPFATTLNQISSDVAKIVQRTFTLKATPVSQSLAVTIDGASYTDFSVNGNVLTLNSVAATSLNLEVTYRQDAVPKASSFKLSQVPAPGSIAATVAGQAVDPTTLSYDAPSGNVEFATEPGDDADIVVTYRQNTALPTTVDLSGLNLTAAPLGVTVDGQPAGDATFDATTKQLAFGTAPTDGAQIGVTHHQPNDQITTYPAPALADPAALVSVAVTDAATQAPLAVTFDAGTLVFDPAEVVDGRAVIVAYDYGDAKTVLSHTLANPPILGSVQTTIDDGSPDCLNDITVVGTTVDFACDATTLGEVAISYKYVAQHYTTFTVDQQIPAGAYVMVFVDGQALTAGQWQQAGQTFTISDTLTTMTSTVRVLASEP